MGAGVHQTPPLGLTAFRGPVLSGAGPSHLIGLLAVIALLHQSRLGEGTSPLPRHYRAIHRVVWFLAPWSEPGAERDTHRQ